MSLTIAMLANRTRTKISRFVVSMWYLPGDMASNAQVVKGFFEANEEDEAKQFTERYEFPPELAIMYDIEEHDSALRRSLSILNGQIRSLEDFGDDLIYEACLSEERQMLQHLRGERQRILDELKEFSSVPINRRNYDISSCCWYTVG